MEAAGRSDIKQLASGYLLGGFKIKMREILAVSNKILFILSLMLSFQSLVYEFLELFAKPKPIKLPLVMLLVPIPSSVSDFLSSLSVP